MDACSLLRALSALSLGAYEEEVYWKMKQEKKRQPFRGKYDGFTLFLVPGLTLCLASLENWFGTNLSVVCSTGGLRLGFALWGILAGVYYMRYTFYLFRLGNYRQGAGKGLVLTERSCGKTRKVRRAFRVHPAAFGFLSIDEAAYLHIDLKRSATTILFGNGHSKQPHCLAASCRDRRKERLGSRSRVARS